MILNFDILYIIGNLLHPNFSELLIKFSTKNKKLCCIKFGVLKCICLYENNVFDIRESIKFGLKHLHNYYINKFMKSSSFMMKDNRIHHTNFLKNVRKRSIICNGVVLKCFQIQNLSDDQLRKFYNYTSYVSELFGAFENFKQIYKSYIHSDFYLIIDSKKQLTNNGYFFVRLQNRSFHLYLNILFNDDKSYLIYTDKFCNI